MTETDLDMTRTKSLAGMVEVEMRANPDKQGKFDELRSRPYFSEVVTANRAYLRTVVADLSGAERERWALSCLPATSPLVRLCAVNMKRMEVFVLYEPEQPADDHRIQGFVIVRRSLLESSVRPGASIEQTYPALTFDAEQRYQDAGEDQIRAAGRHEDLIAALADEHFAAAARDLATELLTGRTNHARHHNYQLADVVLEREPESDGPS